MSSSDRTVSSRPNSFIKARSFALLIFMRRGLTFSTVAVVSVLSSTSPSRSDSMSDRSASSLSTDSAPALGLRPRLAGALVVASPAVLAGRPGRFLGVSVASASTTVLARVVLVSSVAVVLAEGLVTGTVLAFLTTGATAALFLAGVAVLVGGFLAVAEAALAAVPGVDLGDFAGF
jgi:hypothetical protein